MSLRSIAVVLGLTGMCLSLSGCEKKTRVPLADSLAAIKAAAGVTADVELAELKKTETGDLCGNHWAPTRVGGLPEARPFLVREGVATTDVTTNPAVSPEQRAAYFDCVTHGLPTSVRMATAGSGATAKENERLLRDIQRTQADTQRMIDEAASSR